MNVYVAGALGAGAVVMTLLLLPGAETEVGSLPLPAPDSSTWHVDSAPELVSVHSVRSERARPAVRASASPLQAAAEPAFELSALLAHDDERAIAELVRTGTLDPQVLVSRILNGATPLRERELLIEALAQSQTLAAQRALANVTRDALLDAHLLDLAYEALGHTTQPTAETLARLRRAKLDPRRAHRASATRALGILAREAGDASLRSELTRGLLDDLQRTQGPRRRQELLRGVAETGSPQVRATLEQFADAPASDVRALAAAGLGRIPGPEAEVALLTLLEEGLAADRAVAAEALASRAPTSEVVGALCEAVARDQDPGVRSTAVAALLAWSRRGDPAARTPAVTETLAALTPRG